MTIPPVHSSEQFADNMRRMREQRGQSQEAFALAAGLHRTEVTKLESGRRDPKLATLVKVARGLDVPLAELLKGIDGRGDGAAPGTDETPAIQPSVMLG